MMKWLRNHKEIEMPKGELHQLTTGKITLFVEKMLELRKGFEYYRGYKAPNDLASAKARGLLRTYFPTTKLIVGLRHPVR